VPPIPRRRPPTPASAQTFTVPAPTGGLNTISAGLQIPPSDCVLAYNLISSESGLRTRLGYRIWCTGLEGNGSGDEVRSVLPFTGGSGGRIFVTTERGIWDCSEATPNLVLEFATPSGVAGYGVASAMVTSAGRFLLYTDEVNGLHVYTASSNSWAAVSEGTGPLQISGIPPSRFVFVTLFKGRVWFVERDSSDAWYLPTGQLYGAATRFPLSAVFREGGTLVGLWNWTYDGGSGLDDSLVAVSTGGDVLVYQGTDPASASTFGLRGVWQIGATPGGRHIGTTYGGELLLLSRQGIAPLSRLVVGTAGTAEYATAKVSNLLGRLMATRASRTEWRLVQNPEDNALMVVVPRDYNAQDVQLVQAQASRGWFLYRDLPIHSAATWNGRLWFGTLDGRLCVHTGTVDALQDDTYESIDWSLITAPSTLGTPRQKRVGLIRPLIISESGEASYEARARYRYNPAELDPVTLVLDGGGTPWDTAVWDTDVWAGAPLPTQTLRGGGGGTGVEVAIALRGTAIGRTVLVSVDVTYQSGGFL
jgi:hypothetical protein